MVEDGTVREATPSGLKKVSWERARELLLQSTVHLLESDSNSATIDLLETLLHRVFGHYGGSWSSMAGAGTCSLLYAAEYVLFVTVCPHLKIVGDGEQFTLSRQKADHELPRYRSGLRRLQASEIAAY